MENADRNRRASPADPSVITTIPDELKDQRPARIRHKRHSWFKRIQIAARVRGAMRGGSEPAFERFQSGLSGGLPEPAAGGVILAACNDYYYWHFARGFIASFERTGQPQAVHLHLCEPRADAVANIRLLAARLSNVELTWSLDDCRLAEGLGHRTIYYAASRFLLAPLILERTGAPVLAVDIDGIAVGPVWQAYASAAADADIVVIERPEEKKPTMKVLASAVGFNPSVEGTRFAQELANALAATFAIRPRYHVDQITIHALLDRVRCSRNLRVAPMPKQLWDHDFGADAVIWTAKGWDRKDSAGFQEARREVEQFFSGLAADN